VWEKDGKASNKTKQGIGGSFFLQWVNALDRTKREQGALRGGRKQAEGKRLAKTRPDTKEKDGPRLWVRGGGWGSRKGEGVDSSSQGGISKT